MNFTKNWKKATLLTHAGKFHADELFSAVILDRVKPHSTLSRVQFIGDEIRSSDRFLIFDIGYGELDHHQQGGNGIRPNGVKFATCGLVWQKFGLSVLEDFLKTHYKLLGQSSFSSIENSTISELHTHIDQSFIQKIDSDDNGQTPYEFSNIIDLFNPAWNENSDPDAAFEKAFHVAELVFDRVLIRETANLAAKKVIEAALDTAENHILILNQHLAIEPAIFETTHSKASDIYYVIYPSNRSGYNIRTVSIRPGDFASRKPFPAAWAGLSGEPLQKITGVATANFCHNSRFLVVTDTLEDARKIAALAVDAPD